MPSSRSRTIVLMLKNVIVNCMTSASTPGTMKTSWRSAGLYQARVRTSTPILGTRRAAHLQLLDDHPAGNAAADRLSDREARPRRRGVRRVDRDHHLRALFFWCKQLGVVRRDDDAGQGLTAFDAAARRPCMLVA